jgi:hypothetical protein
MDLYLLITYWYVACHISLIHCTGIVTITIDKYAKPSNEYKLGKYLNTTKTFNYMVMILNV